MFELLAAVDVQWGFVGSAIGAGVAALAAAMGIGKIAASATESIARQPECAGDVRGVTIITAAFIEGVCLFAVVVCLLINGSLGAENINEAEAKEAGVEKIVAPAKKND